MSLVRWGGFALVVGGILGSVGAVASAQRLASFDPFSPEREALERGWLVWGLELSGSVGALATAAGLVGLYVLLREPRSWLDLIGVGVACLAAATMLGLHVYELSFVPWFYYQDPGAVYPFIVVLAVFGRPMGVLLLGVAAFRAGVMGRWRSLPLALGLLDSPLLPTLVLSLQPVPGSMEGPQDGFVSAALFGVGLRSGVLVALGYVLLGCLLYRVGRKEEKRRRTALENKALAHRLYEEAWGKGLLGVVDEVADPNLVDRYHDRHGPEGLKRSIAGLRASFPDLCFVLEDQRAEGDTVVTRWTMSGTDRGGVSWYPPTGKTATFSGKFTDRFSDGRLVEHGGVSDTASLLEQLGLPPSSRGG